MMSYFYKLPVVLSLLLIFCPGVVETAKAQNGWINEMPYLNTSPDQGNFLEVVLENVPAFPLNRWNLYLYNGQTGNLIQTHSLAGFSQGDLLETEIFSLYSKAFADLPAGPIGIALAYESELMQFVSYGGGFTAADGIAAGMTSLDIGVEEKETTEAGHSLQLEGNGGSYFEFSWAGPKANTKGSANAKQTFKHSQLLNQSAETLESAALTPFSVLDFELQDQGGDGLSTSLTKLVFEVHENSLGIADAEDRRLEDILSHIYIYDKAGLAELEPSELEFSDYRTLVLHFEEEVVMAGEGRNASYSLKAAISSTAQLEDKTTLTLTALVQEFQTAASSSPIAPSQSNLIGSKVTFNIQATKFIFEEVPALVKGDKPSDGLEEGEMFSVTIKAVDENGRQDLDFNDFLTLDLKVSTGGRDLLGNTYPTMTGGIATSSDLLYSSNKLPESFHLIVNGNAFPGNPVPVFESQEIQATHVQNSNSTVAAVNGSGYNNIPYASYQDSLSLTVANSLKLGTYTFTDLPNNGVNDNLPTKIKAIRLAVGNAGNLQSLALFNGTSNLGELTVSLQEEGYVLFGGLDEEVLNNKSLNLDIRATFLDTVTDNAKVSIRIDQIEEGQTGSQFGELNPSSLIIGGNEADDINRIEVTATKLHFISFPSNAEVEENFVLEIEAIDGLGNRDLDELSGINFTKNSGPGVVSPQPFSANLTVGYLKTEGLQVDTPGLYSFKAEDSDAALNAASSGIFQVFKPYSYAGLLISEVAHGTNSGTPRYIEITNTSSTEYGLENLLIRVYQDGTSTATQEFKFTDGAKLGANESWVISNIDFQTSWGGVFSTKSPDQIHAGIVGNGNDVYEIYDAYQDKVLDVFGEKGVNGSGKDWEYTQKLLNRKSSISAGNGGTFAMNQFTVLPYANALANPGTSTTADASGPAFISALPAAGTQDVLEKSNFTFTFSEALNFEGGKIAIKRKDNDVIVFNADVLNPEFVSGEGTKTLSLNTKTILPGSTELVISIAEGAVTDLAGNNITTFSYEFKTTDSIDPTVISVQPADNAVKVALSPIFRIEFSEPVNKGTGYFSVRNKADGSPVAMVDVASENVIQSEANIISFTITNELERLLDFFIIADEGVVTDLAGNPFAGISDPEAWSFKTIDPYANSPKVVKLNPENGEEHVMQTHTPTITFQEDIAVGTGHVKLYNATTGALLKSIDVASGKDIAITGTKVAFNFGPLSFHTSYYITLDEGAFTDTDPEKNPMEQISSTDAWVFHTVENANPLLVVESEHDPLYFGNVPANTESATKVYRLGGRNLSQDMSLEIPSPFAISLDGGNTYKTGSITLSPAALQGYTNVVVKFAPKETNGTLYQAELVHRSPETKTLRLGVLGREGAQQGILSIAEARAMGVGAEVEISGVVTDGSSFGDSQRYVQDATGAIAIPTSGSESGTIAGLKKGDRVKVGGTLAETFGKLLQVRGESLKIETLETGIALPEPKQIYAAHINELLESQLVEMHNLQFEQAGAKFELNQHYRFTDTKGGKGVLKIEGAANALVNTLIPAVASVKGIITQEEQYYLLPRDQDDLLVKAPQISLSYPDGNLNFGFVVAGQKSPPLRIKINTQDLVEEIIVSVEPPFRLSENSVHFSQSLTLPANSGSASVWVHFAPEAANGLIYRQEIRFNSSSAAEAKAVAAGVEGTRPDMVSIAQARVMKLGEKVSLKGTLTTGSSISVNERYLQDGSAGIVAYLAADKAFAELPVGAEIKVQGSLQEFNGLLQLSNITTWELLNLTAGEPTALLVGAEGMQEQNEARLLKLEGIQFIKEGTFQSGKTYEIKFPDGASGLVKIPAGAHPLVGLRLPYMASLSGVLSESAEGHLLLPRKAEDLQATDAVVLASFPSGDLKFLFVPAGSTSESKSFKISGERLQGNINLATSAPFRISLNGTNFSSSISVPQNNAGDVTIYVQYRPSLAGSGVAEDFVVINTANSRSLKVPVMGVEGNRPAVLPIAQVRALGAGEQVKFQGILTTGSQFFAGKRFVQDETAGILVVAGNSVLAGYEAGDKVELSGTLEEKDNLLQLSKDVVITSIQKGAGIPAARPVSSNQDLNENNEAELIALHNLKFTTAGYFEQGKAYPVQLDNGDQAKVRISGDQHELAGTLIPALANLKAVLVQNGLEYELLLRNAGDLEIISIQKAIILLTAENGYDFGMVKGGTSSFVEQYSVSGLSLDENIQVSVEAPFQVSKDGANWGQTLELNGSAIKEPVYVRFNPSGETGQWYLAKITHTSGEEAANLWIQGTEGVVPSLVMGPDMVEAFDKCFDLNSFTQYDADGLEQWHCAAGWGADNSGAVGINYTGTEHEANEDWLISPAIQIVEGSRLAVDIARKFEGPDLEVLVSTNYSGTGKPTEASWKALAVPIPSPGADLSNFTSIKEVDLSQYAGKNIHVAFKYTSGYEAGSAYMIDNFSIQAMPVAGFKEPVLTIKEGETSTLRISLSLPAKQPGAISLHLTNGSGLIYGKNADLITTPEANSAGELVVQFKAGQEEVTIDLKAFDDLLEEADEHLTIQISGVETGLLLDENELEMRIVIKSNNAVPMDIATAREVNNQGDLLNKDKLVKLKGVAYGPNLSGVESGLEFRLIDHNAEANNAIAVMLAKANSIAYALREGDELEIIGVIKNQDGLAVIVPQKVAVLQQGVQVRNPAVVTALNESTESQLLILEQVEITSGWQNNPASAFQVTVKDEEAREFIIQIRPGTDLYGAEQPKGKISIVGFGAQADASQPYTDGYYLLPRSKADVKQLTALQKDPEVLDLRVFPNPTSGQFYIRSSASNRFERVQIMAANGKVLWDEVFVEGKAFNTASLASGVYIIKITLKGGTYSVSRLSVIR